MQAAAAAVEARATATVNAATANSTAAEISKQEKKAKQVLYSSYIASTFH
jgi:hypothetical protein